MKFKSKLVFIVGLCVLLRGGATAQAVKLPPLQPQATPQVKPAPPPLNIQSQASETAIDSALAEDEATKAMLAPYVGKVRELSQPIGKLAEDAPKYGMGAGVMGNLIADAMRSRAAAKLGQPVILAITNGGGFRKSSLKAGSLSTADIFELLPFDNALVSLDLTGEQLRRFLDVDAGKIVAALDRQHPRDLFDIRDLLAHEGIDDDLRRAFIVYLLSHDRPMFEVLAPRRKGFTEEYLRGFEGMTDSPVSQEELRATREELVATIVGQMPDGHRRFLISFERGVPEWHLLGVPNAAALPAILWRQQNLDKLSEEKRAALVGRLSEILGE